MDNLIGKIRRGGFPLCIEKARLITESFKQTEGEPAVIRYAKVYSHMLENMPVLIDDDELFVGEGASKPWGAEIDPFLGVWKEEEIRGAVEDGIVSIEDNRLANVERTWQILGNQVFGIHSIEKYR